MQEIAAGKIQIVPQVLVGGGESSTSGNLFNAWLAQMMTPNAPKAEKDKGKES
jgi:hypothetical protein